MNITSSAVSAVPPSDATPQASRAQPHLGQGVGISAGSEHASEHGRDRSDGTDGIDYDVVSIPGGRVAVMLAGAGIHWPRLQAAMRAYATVDLAPVDVMHHLDGLVSSAGEMRVPCLYATLDPRTGEFTFVNAGFAAPVISAGSGDDQLVVTLEEPMSEPLGGDGAFGHNAHGQGKVFIDARSEVQFLDGHGAVVLALTNAGSKDSVSASILLSLSEGAPHKARRFCESCLDAWRIDAIASRVLGIVSELVANVVTHAGTDIEVSLIRLESGIGIEVADRNHELPRFGVPGTMDESRRGMVIVDALSSRWGVRRTDTGKTVWAEVDDPE